MSQFTAEQARLVSISAADKRLESALKEIMDTAKSGYTSCLLTGGCTMALQSKLKALGYIIEQVNPADSIRVIW